MIKNLVAVHEVYANKKNKIKKVAANSIANTKCRVENVKSRIFNMDLPLPMEKILRNRIRIVSVITTLVAFVTLYFMLSAIAYILTALIVGCIAMTIDFIVEYKGINKNDWNYPHQNICFRKVPLEIPMLFFSCGVITTFIFYSFSKPVMNIVFSASPLIVSVSFVQMFLLLLGIFFMAQYLRRKCKSLVFGALPLGIALYLEFSEPWILILSIFPMYIDYYLEKRLVKSAQIKYNGYSEEVATNVAITYFPTSLLIFGLVALVHELITIISGV